MFDYGNANPMELTEGIVSVTATDAIGCIANADIELIDPDTLVIEFVEWTEPSCFGLSDGQAVASVTGGTGALQLDWNGADPDGLSSGPVEVTVTDENGCSASIGTSLQQPEALTVFANTESVECAGGTSGSISLAISGGTAPYTEDWNGLDPPHPFRWNLLGGHRGRTRLHPVHGRDRHRPSGIDCHLGPVSSWVCR